MNLNLLSKYRNEIYGFSIIWIILFHSEICNYHYHGIFDILNWGNMGVDIFLFMSGICLYHSFSSDGRIGAFIWKRVLRVFIPVLTICTLYWGYLLAIGEVELRTLPERYLLLQFWISGNRRIWYVSMIMVCYILYPILHGLICHRDGILYNIAMTIVLIALSVMIAMAIRAGRPEYYEEVEIALTRFPVFIAGCGAGRAVKEKRQIPRWPLIVMGVFWIGAYLVLRYGQVRMLFQRYIMSFMGIIITVILSYVLELFKCKGLNRILGFMGNMSLEVYLLQMTLTQVYILGRIVPYLDGVLWPYLLVLAVTVILSYGFSKLDMLIASRLKKIIA